jgi:23S rRNA (adenine2503-C2)-methyltransferase
MTDKIPINSCGLPELEKIVSSIGEKEYRARQLYRWLYFDKVTDFTDMTNISLSLRRHLSDIAEFVSLTEVSRVSSPDAVKFLFSLQDSNFIESVLLKDGERITACISTQVGCRMGCTFCATAKLGFKRNLLAAEIIEQVRLMELAASQKLSNIVFMGMGEPLDNLENLVRSIEILLDEGYGYSHRKITVSTAGLIPELKSLINRLNTPVNIAVSINAADERTRRKLMPISGKYPLSALLAELSDLPIQKRKRITLEYVLIDKVNDSQSEAVTLLNFLAKNKGVRSPFKVNLIRYNSAREGFSSPPEEKVLQFQRILVDSGVTAFIRKSLGQSVIGACGQLRAYSEGAMLK